MKKIITTIIFAIAFGMNVNAQNDGFFSNGNYSEYRDNSDVWGQGLPSLPVQHGVDYDHAAESVPVGSGLLLLGGLAFAYGMRKRK